jgi:hypothetical protein
MNNTASADSSTACVPPVRGSVGTLPAWPVPPVLPPDCVAPPPPPPPLAWLGELDGDWDDGDWADGDWADGDWADGDWADGVAVAPPW